MTFDEKLAQALGETFDERMEKRMEVSEKHKFSLAYRLWEWKTLRNFRHDKMNRKWTLRRARTAVAIIVAAVCLLAGTTTFAVVAAVGRYNFDKQTDYSKMFIENLSSDKTTFEEYYGLPKEDGWELT